MRTDKNRIRVLLVDDHAVVRAGYRMLLRNAVSVEIAAEAETGEQACKQFTDINPDVVVMDLSLPGIGGLEAIRRIISRDPSARILVISMHDDTVFIDQSIRAGAKGYITKNSAPEILIEAITAIANGKTYLDPDLAQTMAFYNSRDDGGVFSSLTTREFEIFRLLAEGHNTSEIAKRLSISYKTVANYSTQIKSKLQVNTVAELARLAIRHNILQP